MLAPGKIMSKREVKLVLDHLHHPSRCRHKNTMINLMVFRLSACCGLRVKEIAGLNVGDVVLAMPQPHIRVRKAITKGVVEQRRERYVPLWWDKGTYEDIKRHIEFIDLPNDYPLVCSLSRGTCGRRIKKRSLQVRWETALRLLSPQRRAQLSIHCGRHTFCSHALAAGRTLPEVRDAAGHTNLATTSIYLHSIPDRQQPPDIFSDETLTPGKAPWQ